MERVIPGASVYLISNPLFLENLNVNFDFSSFGSLITRSN